jgi:hypothetical protein
MVRTDDPPLVDPAWTIKPVTMDDLVLAYMRQARDERAAGPSPLEVLR